MDHSIGISVVVCCYNSKGRVSTTIEHLAKQEVQSNLCWEIIIVDNNSTDNTEQFVKEEWSKYHTDLAFLKVVHEPTAGLSSARKKGIAESKYAYIIFCDDDNWLASNFVETAFAIMNSSVEIGIIGSRIEAVYESTPEPWLLQNAEYLAIGPTNYITDGDITNYPGIVFGAGMVIRKRIFETLNSIGYSFLLSDRKGALLTSCGDTELCFCTRLLGYKIYFSNELTLKHSIPQERMSKEYFRKLMYGFGYSSIHLLPYINALQNVSFSGFKKIKAHWLWQFFSDLKQIATIKLSNQKKSIDSDLSYYHKKGRLASLLHIRNRYKQSFIAVESLKQNFCR